MSRGFGSLETQVGLENPIGSLPLQFSAGLSSLLCRLPEGFCDVASDFSLSMGGGREREEKWVRINEEILKMEITVF